MKCRWESGIWLGVRDESGEVIIGTDHGVCNCRTVRRKGTEEERWDIPGVEAMQGTPDEPEPGRINGAVNIRLKAWTEEDKAKGPECQREFNQMYSTEDGG